MTKTKVLMDIEMLKSLTNYCHFIPQLNGQARVFINKNFPGWDWNDFVPRLIDKKILRFNEKDNPEFTMLSQGLFISSKVRAVELTPYKNSATIRVIMKGERL
jgi:hypothetical protein